MSEQIDSPTLLILSGRDVAGLMAMDRAIDLIDAAMRQVSDGRAHHPARFLMPVGEAGAMGIMPGHLGAPDCFGIKLVSLSFGGAAPGASSHQGMVALFDGRTGAAKAVIEAGTFTALRTAAASAVATRALARRDAKTVAILGTGEQAAWHVDAMAAVRPITQVRVWGRDPDKAARLAVHKAAELGIDVVPAASVAAALDGADIICTTTSAEKPIVSSDLLRPGQHLNLVGSSGTAKQEIDSSVLAKGRFIVDWRAGAERESAELAGATAAGIDPASADIAEIGAVLAGVAPGRTDDSQITVYKSLGLAAQDLAVAWDLAERALAQRRGTVAPFGA